MAIIKRSWKNMSGERRTAWLVRYRDAEGKCRTKTFKTRRDAMAWVPLINAEMRSPDGFALDDR
jgi:integrase